MLNHMAVPHIPNAECTIYQEAIFFETVLHFRTSEHVLRLHLDMIRFDPRRADYTADFAELFYRMSASTNVLPAGTYDTRNPNDFAL